MRTPAWGQVCLFALALLAGMPGGTIAAPNPAPPDRIASSYRSGADLEAAVALLHQKSLNEQGRVNALRIEQAYRELVVAQDVNSRGRDAQSVEYGIIRKLLKEYGMPGDTLLSPEEYLAYRTRGRGVPVAVTPVAQGVSHIRLLLLESGAGSQVSQALHQVPYNRGIVLDLRGSSGNAPQAVADVARQFLPVSAEVLAETITRSQSRRWKSDLRPLALNVPLIVLIDGNTAGGAEVLAAQLGRTGRAQVFGIPTRGADLRTEVFTLPTGAALRLATGHWRMGDGRTMSEGVQPTDPVAGDPLIAALEVLSSRPAESLRPTVFANRQLIGKYQLGFNAGTGDLGIAGAVEYFPAKESNTLRPKDELKIWYVPDYIVFNYKPPSSLFNFFADRIYTSANDAATDKGIHIGSSFIEVIEAYGGPEKNGYNEIFPFPDKSRGNHADRFYVNYDALGLSFGFEIGTNVVREIGIFKPGS